VLAHEAIIRWARPRLLAVRETECAGLPHPAEDRGEVIRMAVTPIEQIRHRQKQERFPLGSAPPAAAVREQLCSR